MYDYWDLLKMYEKTKKENTNLKSKLFDKENIIKEAREFVERYLKLNLEAFDTKSLLEKILEILDKGE